MIKYLIYIINYRSDKMKTKKGISLIVLVITIIVIIILAGSVILSLSQNNPIASASEAKFKVNIDSYNSELTMAISEKYVLDFTFVANDLNATVWGGNPLLTTGTIKQYIKSITVEDGAKYAIVSGKLVYVGTTTNEKQWVSNAGISTGILDFSYSGTVQKFIAPITGTYTLETWGASGGGDTNQLNGSHKGLGGYSKGNISLTIGQIIYIYIGGQGTPASTSPGIGGGWNGGGNAVTASNGSLGYGGGGGTDIRTVNGLWDDSTSLASRILVAGGGGGTDDITGELLGITNDGSGGSGGGLIGENARINGAYTVGTGGTQSVGTLGKGQDVSVLTDSGGGGGGYRGGFASNSGGGGGGGGSGFIGIGITAGTTQNGTNDGNGYVRITLL
jgi:hypothetical protein